MNKLLVVVDMQNDFVSGSLGTEEARSIVENVKMKIREYQRAGAEVVFTRDTHTSCYLDTQEGQNLPVVHCIKDTEGWELVDELKPYANKIFDKPTFGSVGLAEYAVAKKVAEVEIVGVCTDICVVSNALLLKAYLTETKISVDASCCAGVTQESHEAALETMKMCQVYVTGQ